MRKIVYLICLAAFSLVYCQTEKPFQVLVAEKATALGAPLNALDYVDDVTRITIEEGGFVSLVHESGTTFELVDDAFTFYLKADKSIQKSKRPDLQILYNEDPMKENSKLIEIISPDFDRSGFISWKADAPMNLFWHASQQKVLTYLLSIKDQEGNKIQDYRTQKEFYTIKPYTYGLQSSIFSFQLSSVLGGDTLRSKTYTVELKPMKELPKKASDLVLNTIDLEVSPTLALPIWEEVLETKNGLYFKSLYAKFLQRNSTRLSESGVDLSALKKRLE